MHHPAVVVRLVYCMVVIVLSLSLSLFESLDLY